MGDAFAAFMVVAAFIGIFWAVRRAAWPEIRPYLLMPCAKVSVDPGGVASVKTPLIGS
ncbi:MAG TPA: hypothetical protein VII08_25150 [Myxococcales bacterium]